MLYLRTAIGLFTCLHVIVEKRLVQWSAYRIIYFALPMLYDVHVLQRYLKIPQFQAKVY